MINDKKRHKAEERNWEHVCMHSMCMLMYLYVCKYKCVHDLMCYIHEKIISHRTVKEDMSREDIQAMGESMCKGPEALSCYGWKGKKEVENSMKRFEGFWKTDLTVLLGSHCRLWLFIPIEMSGQDRSDIFTGLGIQLPDPALNHLDEDDCSTNTHMVLAVPSFPPTPRGSGPCEYGDASTSQPRSPALDDLLMGLWKTDGQMNFVGLDSIQSQTVLLDWAESWGLLKLTKMPLNWRLTARGIHLWHLRCSLRRAWHVRGESGHGTWLGSQVGI